MAVPARRPILPWQGQIPGRTEEGVGRPPDRP
jgi:hypothetical protein